MPSSGRPTTSCSRSRRSAAAPEVEARLRKGPALCLLHDRGDDHFGRAGRRLYADGTGLAGAGGRRKHGRDRRPRAGRNRGGARPPAKARRAPARRSPAKYFPPARSHRGRVQGPGSPVPAPFPMLQAMRPNPSPAIEVSLGASKPPTLADLQRDLGFLPLYSTRDVSRAFADMERNAPCSARTRLGPRRRGAADIDGHDPGCAAGAAVPANADDAGDHAVTFTP